MYRCMHIYIYIEREREMHVCMYVCICIYIYIYTYCFPLRSRSCKPANRSRMSCQTTRGPQHLNAQLYFANLSSTFAEFTKVYESC